MSSRISQVSVYRDDLKRVVRSRLDPRVARRVDPADVVQDVMLAAHGQVEQWQRDGKSIYACLYRLTRDQIARLHRDHVHRQKRSVSREESQLRFSDESVLDLAARIVSSGTSPSRAVVRKERRDQVREALALLRDNDREILMMRIMEGLSSKEVAEILSLTRSAVDMRHLRALQRIRALLNRLDGDSSP